MADYSANVAKMARLLAIAHIIVGFLLICFGIADSVTTIVNSYDGFWTGYVFFGIWIGVWMCITGGLGIPGSGRDRTRSRNIFAAVFMGFSITSAVLGGVIIICYSISIAINRSEYRYNYDYGYGYIRGLYDAKMAITAIILVLGVAEFVIGIWAAICCCLIQPCCATQQGQQVMDTNLAGYVMTQDPSGHPVTVPIQGGGGMVPVQASGAQGGLQPPMVLMPVSGATGGQPMIVPATPSSVMAAGNPPQQVQPQFVQVNTSEAMTATGFQPQQTVMPPSYGHGKYMPLDEQIPVKT